MVIHHGGRLVAVPPRICDQLTLTASMSSLLKKKKPRTRTGTRAIPRFHLILLSFHKNSLSKFKSKLCAITGSHRNLLLHSDIQLADVIHG